MRNQVKTNSGYYGGREKLPYFFGQRSLSKNLRSWETFHVIEDRNSFLTQAATYVGDGSEKATFILNLCIKHWMKGTT